MANMDGSKIVLSMVNDSTLETRQSIVGVNNNIFLH